MTIDVELASYADLDERIIILRAGDEVDAVFVRTERFGVLVDTLGTPSLCRRALEKLEDRLRGLPLVVVNSHMDWDHFWGNSALSHVPIIAHSRAIERLKDPSVRQTLERKALQEARFGEVEIVSPTMTFSGDRMTLHGGDLTLDLLHTPGHTPDHVAVWIPELRVCLAVDAVESPIPKVWSNAPADLRDLCTSLRRLQALEPRHVILAHGQTAAPSVIADNLAYFTKLTEAVASQDNDNMPLEDLLKRADLQLESFINFPEAMPSTTRAFYRRFHKSNLNAAISARRAGFKVL